MVEVKKSGFVKTDGKSLEIDDEYSRMPTPPK
jgi:hypothetical protein